MARKTDDISRRERELYERLARRPLKATKFGPRDRVCWLESLANGKPVRPGEAAVRGTVKRALDDGSYEIEQDAEAAAVIVREHLLSPGSSQERRGTTVRAVVPPGASPDHETLKKAIDPEGRLPDLEIHGSHARVDEPRREDKGGSPYTCLISWKNLDHEAQVAHEVAEARAAKKAKAGK